MTASATKHRDSAESLLQEMLDRMEHLAANGEWIRVEASAEKVCAIALQLPVTERADAIELVMDSIARVGSMARFARREVTERLSAIRRGRTASIAYGESAHGGLGQPHR